MSSPRLLYCNCTYAQVVPAETKAAVLRHLSESGQAFEAVADLCELSARRDPSLKRLAESGTVKVVACFPRAVKWLFASSKATLPQDGAEIINMRTLSPAEVIGRLESSELQPNLPADTKKPVGVEAP